MKQPDFKVFRGCFLMLVKKNFLNISRLGLIVAKKKAKKAVDRNRTKRIIRESFRAQLAHLTTLDVVVLVTQPCAAYDNKQLRSYLDEAWQILLKKSH